MLIAAAIVVSAMTGVTWHTILKQFSEIMVHFRMLPQNTGYVSKAGKPIML